MTDVTKTTFDLKTVGSWTLFIAALVANNIRGEYNIKINAINQEIKYKDMILVVSEKADAFEARVKNRDDLQDRDIQDVNNQIRLNVKLGISIDFGKTYKDIH